MHLLSAIFPAKPDTLSSVFVQLYSPLRPLVDIAEVFLWLMAVGTILCASYWSAWTAREAALEQEKLLKVTFAAQGQYLCKIIGGLSFFELVFLPD